MSPTLYAISSCRDFAPGGARTARAGIEDVLLNYMDRVPSGHLSVRGASLKDEKILKNTLDGRYSIKTFFLCSKLSPR